MSTLSTLIKTQKVTRLLEIAAKTRKSKVAKSLTKSDKVTYWAALRASDMKDPCTDLIFVTNITKYIRGGRIVMWRNFSFPCTTIVGKLKISPHVEKFQYNLWGFIAIYAVLLLNLLFTLF